MRLCPSVDGSNTPLITHRIGAEVCMARQRTFFHKCHRCIYRGQPANWEPAEAPMAMLNVHAPEEPPHADAAAAEIARPARAPKSAAAKSAEGPASKPAAKPAKKSKPAPKTVDVSA